MNRVSYFDYIEEKLNVLSTRIKRRGKINLLELNIHSEFFFAELCNKIFNLQLVNINILQQNTEGIDLIDTENKILIQVSSTCTKAKVEDSLNKEIYKTYEGFSYKFLSIAKDATTPFKKNKFKNPYKLKFNPKDDIWDSITLLRVIQEKSIDEQRELYELVKKEIGNNEIDLVKVDTNLAHIINILANETLSDKPGSPEINEFEIEEKIRYNKLTSVKDIIDDYKIYYSKLDMIYSEFDKQGKNKSFSVFQEIRRQYRKLKETEKNPEKIFYKITEVIISIIVKSANYEELPFEEIQLCVDIIVVDAFIRCKIFENPGGYNHVIA